MVYTKLTPAEKEARRLAQVKKEEGKALYTPYPPPRGTHRDTAINLEDLPYDPALDLDAPDHAPLETLLDLSTEMELDDPSDRPLDLPRPRVQGGDLDPILMDRIMGRAVDAGAVAGEEGGKVREGAGGGGGEGGGGNGGNGGGRWAHRTTAWAYDGLGDGLIPDDDGFLSIDDDGPSNGNVSRIRNVVTNPQKANKKKEGEVVYVVDVNKNAEESRKFKVLELMNQAKMLTEAEKQWEAVVAYVYGCVGVDGEVVWEGTKRRGGKEGEGRQGNC